MKHARDIPSTDYVNKYEKASRESFLKRKWSLVCLFVYWAHEQGMQRAYYWYLVNLQQNTPHIAS